MSVTRGEMRLVSVLMADVEGSTAIAERLGSERSKLLFDEVTGLISRQVERFGGTVAQLAGDSVLAVFGAPTAHDDDAERAVLAAIELQRDVRRYSEQVAADYGVTLAARVGIESGRVVVDWEAGSDRERFNALGDPVNMAARLQEQAGAGSVVVGPELARVVAGRFELDDLGEVALKGIAAPVRLLRVDGAEVECARHAEPPLVGRDYERALLDRAVAELADGLGVIMVVTGEAGIGKTRLVRDVVEEAPVPPCLLEGRGSSYAMGFPLWPFRDLMRTWLDLPIAAGDSRRRLELKARLTELFGELGERYVFLAAAMGLPPEGAEAAQVLAELSPQNVRDRTAHALGDVICRLADERPVLVMMDDLHWADAATIAVIQDLLDLTERTSVGFALIYRSERESSAWRLGQHAREQLPHRYREVELRALASDAGKRLAESVVGAPLPADLTALVSERSGGNPFFIEEAVRDLVERDVLSRGPDGALELCVDMDEVAVPAVVQAALQARLGRLTAQTREVATICAAVGRTFGMGLLEAMFDREVVRTAVLELQRFDLIAEERRRPEPEYRFRHGLVQEVAYASLLEHDRRAAHRRIAEALVRLADSSGQAAPTPVLARHLAEADMPAEAADALIAAGDEARAMWATAEAVDDYRRARGFLARLDDERRARETLFKIALVHHVDFDFGGAESAYDAAFACRVPPPLSFERDQRLRAVMPPPPEIAPGYVYVLEAGTVTDLLFRGLLSLDRDMNVVPSLAENMRVSADGRSYLFQLQEGLRWSDGEPLTTHDFVYTWDRIRELRLPTAFLLDDVREAVAHDDRTLEVIVEEPRSAFLYQLSHVGMRPWPRHVVEGAGDDWRSGCRVTSGPYMGIERTDERMLLRANPYWAGATGNVGEIEVRFVEGGGFEEPGRELWKAGEVDVLLTGTEPPEDDVTRAFTSGGMGTLQMVMIARKSPVSHRLVRQAIAAAIDPNQLMAAMPRGFGAVRGAGVLPPSLPGHSRRSGLKPDRARAAELLEAAGYPGGRGLQPIKLEAHSWVLELARMTAAQLAEVGIPVEVLEAPHAFGHLTPAIQRGDVFFSSWNADYPDPEGFFRGLLHEGLGIYHDDTTVRLMAEGRAERNHDRRLETYQELDRYLVQDVAVMVPLGYPRTTMLVRPWIDGVWTNAGTGLRLGEAIVDPLRYPAPQ